MVPDHRRSCCVRCTEQPVLAQVIELLPAHFALVDTATGLEEVSLSMIDARIGDFVLIHAGRWWRRRTWVDRRQISPAAAGAAPDR